MDMNMPIFYRQKSRIFGVQGIVKRFFDILLSCIALTISMPAMTLVALCIKLDDGGPVLLKQTRLTQDGREFRILKFRSMIPNAEEFSGAVIADKKDWRITRVGHILRNTKLDELPQFINVLLGDMSLVGPRPERPELMEKARKAAPNFDKRLQVKAGLTGLAQIKGGYHTSFADKLQWDLQYIEEYSLLLDLKILLLTAFVPFRKDSSEDTEAYSD